MKEKLKHAIQLLSAEDNSKVQVFLSILEDMKLGDDKKLEGVLYYLFKSNLISIDEIKQQYDEEIINVILNNLLFHNHQSFVMYLVRSKFLNVHCSQSHKIL